MAWRIPPEIKINMILDENAYTYQWSIISMLLTNDLTWSSMLEEHATGIRVSFNSRG